MKNLIRNELLNIRKNLSKDDVTKNSQKIIERLKENELFRKAEIILHYVSYDNEVFTHDMIKDQISKGKTVFVPISNKEDNTLILSKLSNWNDLEKGAYGILEPKKTKIKEIKSEKIEIIIVPGLGFDKKGNRIGHGKGYYDRLLKKYNSSISIGLAFNFQIVENIPNKSHDVPVDMILTENQTIFCNEKFM